MSLPVVAIIGRPNVGKSTLFNRIAGKRDALVHDLPGVTRDRKERTVTAGGKRFRLVDTGGMQGDGDVLADAVTDQALRAARSADLILFVVDGKDGLLPVDESVGNQLRRTGRPVLVVVNKVDQRLALRDADQFHRMGLGPLFRVSAEHGGGVADLLDEVAGRIPGAAEDGDTEPAPLAEGPQVAVVGRPNVGKSSLVNRLLGEDRVIVSPVSGTTRDWVDLPFTFDGHPMTLVDTAGIRRRARTEKGPEVLSVVLTRQRIERADVAVVVVDALDGVTHQDATVAGWVEELGKARVLFVNKWDGLEPGDEDVARVEYTIARRLAFVQNPVVVRGSAQTGQGVGRLLPAVWQAWTSYSRTFPTAQLNDALQEILARTPPPSLDGREVRIKYITQTGERPPTFTLFSNTTRPLPESWTRHLTSELTARLGLVGTPVKLVFRRK